MFIHRYRESLRYGPWAQMLGDDRGLAFPRENFPTELFVQMDEFLIHTHTK